MYPRTWTDHARLLCGAAVIALAAGSAQAAELRFDIPAQPLSTALSQWGVQSQYGIFADSALTSAKTTAGVAGEQEPEAALSQLLTGTGLSYRRQGDSFVIVRQSEGGSGPQSESAGGDVEALIVTAQKREEAIQDVPIAISAFSQKALEEQKIEGGYDLLKAIPNVSFSKSNFTSYNFSIRGVGTKAISATTDPGVAVAFNNTALIQNRLFEQEYFDVERVEVLRGPQGTLYGRNATSGVINVISAKPKLNEFQGSAKVEVGNYDTKRLVGMVNIPIIQDVLGVRLAGAMTQRGGFDYNEGTGNNVNGRDLWSGRLTIGFEPSERLRANVIWEHFSEDDDRSRTGKQLCHNDPGPTVIGSTNVVNSGVANTVRNLPYKTLIRRGLFSQGCQPGNLYDDAAFGTPNGLALPFVFAPLFLGAYNGTAQVHSIGFDPVTREDLAIIKLADPYGGLMQSRDLRTISSFRDPVYRAQADVFELNIDFDVTDALTLSSQTAYNEDEVYSFQDYNRFNSFPIFTDTSQMMSSSSPSSTTPSTWRNLAPGGFFDDPQLGRSDKMAGFDISQAVGKQFSQELRLQSDFDGPVNFSVGANYTKFETLIDYYVMFNLITGLALVRPFYAPPTGGSVDPTICPFSGNYDGLFSIGNGPVPQGSPTAVCPYIDPNPVENISGDGHNYFRSKNPYRLKSYAGFGEMYWNVTDALKLTAGLRYTKDRKTFIPVPSQVLLSPGPLGGGTVSRGYPENDPIIQEWGEWTGRFGVDWKPELGFTDQTLLYAFYSRGYKGGGANPPSPGFASEAETRAYLEANGLTSFQINFYYNPAFQRFPVLSLNGVDYAPTFEPEFVNSFEVGAKNTLLGGAMTFNATGFYYDYKDYQVSQIKDRTAVNENFDATIWGLEFETTFAPSRDLKFVANLGYLDTSIADGETSIDIMDRTQGDPNFVVTKPWEQLPSNCVVPVPVAEAYLNKTSDLLWAQLCGGYRGILGIVPITDPRTGQPYDPLTYDGTNGTTNINGGAGIRAQLGGNELPSAPHWTMNLGGQYGRDILDGSWRVTLRGDAYWQSQSWARVYNAVNDKLHGWYNLNVGVTLANEDLGVQAEFYIKNLLDKSPITDAFLNSDDTGLTTNVFVLDPRLVGFSLRKTF